MMQRWRRRNKKRKKKYTNRLKDKETEVKVHFYPLIVIQKCKYALIVGLDSLLGVRTYTDNMYLYWY